MLLDGIDMARFTNAGTVADLYVNRCADIPQVAGVYVVVRPAGLEASLDARSSGGRYKERDPSYSEDVVAANWVDGACVLYVGMTASKKGLRDRVRKLTDFGQGKAVPHRGGRLLWHLTSATGLEVWWSECDRSLAQSAESELIDAFRSVHGVRPFANMVK